MDKKHTVAPLPLDKAGKLERITPGSESASSAAVTPPIDERTPAEKWIADNPTFEETPAAEKPAVEAVAETPVEQPAETPTDKPITDAPVAEKPAEAPDVTPTTEAAKPAEPVATAPVKPEFKSDEVIHLIDGENGDWTREQIVTGLKERAQFRPLVAEAEKFRTIFNISAEQAETTWKPLLERLKAEPNTVKFLDGYLYNADRREYLDACASFFDAQQAEGGKPVANTDSVNKLAPEAGPQDTVSKELEDLRKWRESVEMERATERITREMSVAVSQYPFLANDAALREDLVLTAQQLNARNPQHGIPEAVALKKSLYEVLAASRAAQPVQPAQPEPVAVLGGQGASPNATRPSTPSRPQKFEDKQSAIDDWLAKHPQEF